MTGWKARGRVALSSAFLTLCFSAQSIAAPFQEIVVSCKGKDGSAMELKVSENAWNVFDRTSWAWKPFHCDYPGFTNVGETTTSIGATRTDTLSCKTSYDEDSLTYELSGYQDADFPRINAGFSRRLSKIWNINRTSGLMQIVTRDQQDGWGNFRSYPQRVDSEFLNCEKTTDQSLSPRPAPPQRKF